MNRAQEPEIIGAVTQKFGGLAEFDNTCFDEVVLRILQRPGRLGADSVSSECSCRE